MQLERVRHSVKRESRLLILALLAAILCLSHVASAQSGRNRETPQARPTSTAVEESKAEPADEKAEPQDEESAPVPASAIILSGNLVHNSAYYRSKDVSNAIKEVERNLKERPFLNVIRGGKMTRAVAQAAAKKETDTYVLWMELVMSDGPLGETLVSYIDYLVFAPQTGKVFTYGRVVPMRKIMRVENGARIMLGGGTMTNVERLMICGEEIAERLRKKLEPDSSR